MLHFISYTMTTVGAEGFLNMLPVYMEHVLFPTLTEAGYVTEVHHVDSTGEDAGVVYCEMQGRENDADETVQRHMVRNIFPDEECGYRACTGGILKNLRESTSHAKVVDFHKQFYRPENLCVVVAGGGIRAEDVFRRLEGVEDAWLKMQGNRRNICQNLQRLLCCKNAQRVIVSRICINSTFFRQQYGFH